MVSEFPEKMDLVDATDEALKAAVSQLLGEATVQAWTQKLTAITRSSGSLKTAKAMTTTLGRLMPPQLRKDQQPSQAPLGLSAHMKPLETQSNSGCSWRTSEKVFDVS